MIFDLMSQEDEIASARKAAGLSEQRGMKKVLQRILWRYFLVVWCFIGMAFGLKAVAIGAFVIWIGHPVLIGMRLSALSKQNRILRDSEPRNWFVSMGGIADQVKISSLNNVLFYSLKDMQTVLVGFCRARFLLYAAALLVALYDFYLQWQGVHSGDHLSQLAAAMALANVGFFTQRSVTYYRLLTLGQRQAWQVCTTTIDSHPMFAAYKQYKNKEDNFYLPYLLATFTPQAA